MCNELRDITVFRVNRVVVSSVGTALVLFLVLAGVGYATFGSLVATDILVSYPSEGIIF